MNYTKIRKYRYDVSQNYNLFLQHWYNFHHLFFGSLIFRGRKIAAYNMILDIKFLMKKQEKCDPFLIFLVCFLRMQPQVLIVSIRKRGVLNEVPFPITPRKQLGLTIRWLISILKNNNKCLKAENIAKMLISSIYNEGAFANKKSEFHRLSISNRDIIRRFLK